MSFLILYILIIFLIYLILFTGEKFGHLLPAFTSRIAYWVSLIAYTTRSYKVFGWYISRILAMGTVG